MTTNGGLVARGQRIARKICRKHGWTEEFASSWVKRYARDWAKGYAIAKAEAVLGVLAHREVAVSATLRKRVLASRDELELQRWFDLAFTVASAKELFEPPQGAVERRAGAGARAGRARGGRRRPVAA